MKTTAHADTRCPSCAAALDRSTCMTGRSAPAAGALTVCAYCAAPLVYTSYRREALTLRTLSAVEIAALPPQHQRFLEEIRKAIRGRKPH